MAEKDTKGDEGKKEPEGSWRKKIAYIAAAAAGAVGAIFGAPFLLGALGSSAAGVGAGTNKVGPSRSN
jgi:hypothetical protein